MPAREGKSPWAQNYLDTGNVVSKARMTFALYAEHFFDWEGAFCQTKLMKGRILSSPTSTTP